MKDTIFASTAAHLEPAEAMRQLHEVVNDLLADTHKQMGSIPWRVESSSHTVTPVDGQVSRKTGLLGMSTENVAVTKYLATAFLIIPNDAYDAPKRDLS